MKTLLSGKVLNTHGLHGELKTENYLDEGYIDRVKTVFIDGERYKITGRREHKGFLLLKLAGVEDIDAAMRLKNREIFIDRAELGLPEGQFFYSDLYGFEVFDRRTGRAAGTLVQVMENPACLLLEIEDGGKKYLVPETPFYEGADLEKKVVFINTIPGMLPDEN
ncbi:MAG: 16S rRNA processing protein RimM [Clostridia bacterium]|nr:16S rRNA processing protein RimM [Clostridia bacterium]